MNSMVLAVFAALIVLLAVPSDATISCYDTDMNSKQCSDGTEWCTKAIAGSVISRGCDGTGTVLSPAPCKSQGAKCALNSASVNFCCCNGNNCNTATQTVVGTATVVASIAAIIAAKLM